MADAPVEFLLENLKQLLLYHGHLIGSAKQHVEKLEEDLRLFRAFLRDTTKKRRKDDELQEVVRQIRVYEAEDAVDCFVTQAAENKSRNYFVRAFKTTADLHTIARKIEPISRKVSAIYGDKTKIDFAIQRIGDGEQEESEELATPPAYYIFFGANDSARLEGTGERQHVPLEEYKENLRKMVLTY